MFGERTLINLKMMFIKKGMLVENEGPKKDQMTIKFKNISKKLGSFN